MNLPKTLQNESFIQLMEKYKKLSPEEEKELHLKQYNDAVGDLNENGEYDCPICKNKGFIYTYGENSDEIRACQCKCMKIRKTLYDLKKSGLSGVCKKYTFENYKVKEPWQADIKKRALDFCNDTEAKAFYIGGQSGAGKTHICTAITLDFIKRGVSCKYMLWRDESVRLKAIINDAEEYSKEMDELKSVDFLYIDDFLKTNQSVNPTIADINLAFEIVNYRFVNGKRTIFSSEFLIGDIIKIDEATGGRIFENAGKEYCISIAKSIAKNYRIS